MTNLLESFADTVSGAAESAGSIVERLTNKRVEEFSTGRKIIDHMIESMGIEPYVDPEMRVSKANKDTNGQMNMIKEVQPNIEVASPAVDIGAFRRREEANRLVDQAHAQPAVVATEPEMVTPVPPTFIEQPAQTDAQAEARQLVESALAGQVDPADQLTSSLREMGYHDQISL